MTDPEHPGLRNFLLEGSRGLLLATYHPPVGHPHPSGDILLAPPFAEEMNRCRAMVSLQARALAKIGVGTLIVDPFGTGDSAGDFADGSWELWQDDLSRGLDWLRAHGNGCRTVWGVRLGAIMAAEIAVQFDGIARLLLWQPVLSGKSFFTQFLRIRIAAELNQSDGTKTTDELRQKLASGESVEVSGYRISADLARTLDRVRLPEPSKLGAMETTWFEILPSAETKAPSANVRAVEEYRAVGASVHMESVVGPPFWQVHERELAPELVAATARAVGSWQPGQVTPRAVQTASPSPPASHGTEMPLVFACGSDQLAGILHRGSRTAQRGVVIVVAGGPQYRVGAHRQFVGLARKLAAQGYPVLRFDLRGMGDSNGVHMGFQQSEPDIRAAIDTLIAQEPQVRELVLFGECESASGILFYAWRDSRVTGIALVNPWVRTDEGRAQVLIKHYYLHRLRSPEFWKKVREGRLDVRRSLGSLVSHVRAYLRGRKMMARLDPAAAQEDISELPLPVKTAEGLKRFRGQVMLLMSGRDYIAREFDEVTGASKAWSGLLENSRIRRRDLLESDHTFSREAWKNKASDWIVEWIRSW